MNIDIETVIQTYLTLKEYIPLKDRQGAADNLMSELTEVLTDQDLKEMSQSDAFMKNAYKEYAPHEDDDDTHYED